MARASAIRLVAAAILLTAQGVALGDTLWFQGAESGYAGIIDGTDSSYDLIQASVVAEGDYAFHMTHLGLGSEYFVLNPDATPQADSNLYFLGRFGAATPAQVAKVQVSTNAGSTWDSPLYNQPGYGESGSGVFGLHTISLGSYAGQDISLRFSFDFNGGSYYPGPDTGTGWIVDSVQIGDSIAKQQYDIGQPSDQEQLMLEYINRARADALVEADRLADLYDTDSRVRSAMNQYGMSKASVINGFQNDVNSGEIDQYAQPLAFHGTLNEAAELHSQDQLDNDDQSHVSSSNPPAPFQEGWGPTQRVQSLGYPGGVAENVYAYADDVPFGHAGFDIDWGVNPPGHRHNIHDNDYKEIGIGIVEGSNDNVGPMIITQNFGPVGAAAFITGVVYEDLNENNFYDVGEGRSGVQVDVDGSPYFAISTNSGGYAVPVTADGSYDVTFSGGGWDTYLTTASVSGLENVKIDYLVSAPMGLAGDFNEDGVVDAADYTVWRDNDGGAYTQDDYDTWRQNYGMTSVVPEAAAAPEPAAATLLGLVLLGGGYSTRRWK